MCTGCAPADDPQCSLQPGPETFVYIANLELFTLKIDHSISASEFSLYQSSTQMASRGVVGIDDKDVDICKGLWRVVLWRWLWGL